MAWAFGPGGGVGDAIHIFSSGQCFENLTSQLQTVSQHSKLCFVRLAFFYEQIVVLLYFREKDFVIRFFDRENSFDKIFMENECLG